jgi:hypothetical protein
VTLIVTVEDVRQAKLCIPGARLWCKRHGIDWHRFLESGVEASRLIETRDAMAARAVEAAQRRHDGR